MNIKYQADSVLEACRALWVHMHPGVLPHSHTPHWGLHGSHICQPIISDLPLSVSDFRFRASWVFWFIIVNKRVALFLCQHANRTYIKTDER